jgi:hypothetical protein
MRFTLWPLRPVMTGERRACDGVSHFSKDSRSNVHVTQEGFAAGGQGSKLDRPSDSEWAGKEDMLSSERVG